VKQKRLDTNKVVINKTFFVIGLLLFCTLIVRLGFLCLFDFNVGSVSVKEFVANRNINKQTITPTRGTIYDVNGNVLATDVSSYTVVAYLDPEYSKDSDVPLHVVDKEETAKALSPIINMSEEAILNLLNKENLFQVELGPGGRGITELVKDEIKSLNLPGINFIKGTKRYYPNDELASYTLGYVKEKAIEEGSTCLVGELGIEQYYDDLLKGEEGYIEFEKDRQGIKIPNTNEIRIDAINGKDIYLTIDSNLQLHTESMLKKAVADSQSESGLIIVAEAKTGKILSAASMPTFNPNIRNLTSYLDPFTANPYEPGSTMKIYSYMAAIEKGTYDGEETYMSGKKEYVNRNDETKISTINDWNKTGWGEISYDLGFALSSNIAVANLTEKYITGSELRSFYSKFGFGEKTNYPIIGEKVGTLEFNYPIEVAIAGYGQGITTTPMQHVKALTAIANDGELLEPYVVYKIVDGDTGEIYLQNNRKVLDRVVSEKTVEKIKDLMESVINNDPTRGTGSAYKIEGYDLIGKTGTAQIYNYKEGKYSDAKEDSIYSFAGMFPKDEPEIIIYAMIEKPKTGSSSALSTLVKEVVINITKNFNINPSDHDESKDSLTITSYQNKKVNDVKSFLEENYLNVIVLGDGDKIIKQYPESGSLVYKNDKVFLLTNSTNLLMPDLTDFSYKEVVNILNLMNVNYNLEGYGYVYEQSIEANNKIPIESDILIKLRQKYLEENIP